MPERRSPADESNRAVDPWSEDHHETSAPGAAGPRWRFASAVEAARHVGANRSG